MGTAQAATAAKCQLHLLLGAANVHSPYRVPFGKRGRRWLATLDLGLAANMQRDELLQTDTSDYGRNPQLHASRDYPGRMTFSGGTGVSMRMCAECGRWSAPAAALGDVVGDSGHNHPCDACHYPHISPRPDTRSWAFTLLLFSIYW